MTIKNQRTGHCTFCTDSGWGDPFPEHICHSSAMQERSVEKTDYSTFLSNVERGNVSKAEVQDDYIYYVVRKNGEDVVCKTVRMDDPDLVSRLYEAGTSMEAVEPQKQSIFLSLVIDM